MLPFVSSVHWTIECIGSVVITSKDFNIRETHVKPQENDSHDESPTQSIEPATSKTDEESHVAPSAATTGKPTLPANAKSKRLSWYAVLFAGASLCIDYT